MKAGTDALLEAALALTAEDRARLAVELIASLDGEPDEGVEAAWDAEVARRIEQAERGEAELTDWDTVSLSTNPKFLELIERSRARQRAEGGISADEMRRRLASIDS